jgi:SAM-dependent methyltransferase
MAEMTYEQRRGQIEDYFDRTAAAAWEKLTSDAPVGRIRASVRAGRDEMRNTLLSWLPADLSGKRVLDAGCGTGAFAVEAARRGAQVVAIDLSPTLVNLARERLPADLASRIQQAHVCRHDTRGIWGQPGGFRIENGKGAGPFGQVGGGIHALTLRANSDNAERATPRQEPPGA